MPLTAPPDNSRTFLCLAVGVCTAITIGLLTRNTLPHVGDNLHSLPHGGNYFDGTKAIYYGGPKKISVARNFLTDNSLPALAIFLLVGLIIGVSTYQSKKCHCCGRLHA